MLMTRIDPTIRRETGYVSLWVTAAILPVQAVFLLLGRWDYTVLLGSLLGSVTAVGNFLLVGLMVQTAVTQTEKQARNTVRLSQGGRLLLQGLILVAAAVLPWFNIWAAAIPLLVPRVAVSVRARRTKDDQSPSAEAEDPDDDPYDDDE